MYEPMLCQPGDIDTFTSDDWSFEAKHDGCRLIAVVGDDLTLLSRTGRDATADYAVTITSDHTFVLDGEIVSLDADGHPDFHQVQIRTDVRYWAFDILELDGRDLTRVPYRQRRQILERIAQLSSGFTVPPLLDADTGAQAMALTRGREGVVAKRWDSRYEPGKRSGAWVKAKHWLEEDCVIGGWKWGNGSRENTIGSVLLGIPTEDGLQFCGRVGTGFTDAELERLLDMLVGLATDESPFAAPVTGNDAKNAVWVKPELTAAVQYGLKTADGRLRHPSWRGLRPE